MIEIKGLSKSFGSEEVLKGLNYSFEPAKVYGIVGENGAGKTTLFRCIAGLENHSGKIDFQDGSLKGRIGLLVTNPKYMSRLTAREYLWLMLQGRGQSLSELDEKNIFDLPLDQYADSYSTGMKKKLALLAVLLQRNELFILDEPFNGVDYSSSFLIDQIIASLREKGKYVILSSHIFSTLTNNCDEIITMKNGTFDRVVPRSEFDQLEHDLKRDLTEQRMRKLDFLDSAPEHVQNL